MKIKDIDLLNSGNDILTSSNQFGINNEILKEYGFSYTKLFYEYLCVSNSNLQVDIDDNAFDFFIINFYFIIDS